MYYKDFNENSLEVKLAKLQATKQYLNSIGVPTLPIVDNYIDHLRQEIIINTLKEIKPIMIEKIKTVLASKKPVEEKKEELKQVEEEIKETIQEVISVDKPTNELPKEETVVTDLTVKEE